MEDLFLHGLLLRRKSDHQSSAQDDELAKNRDLSAGLKSHLEETTKQIGRLDQVFAKLGKEPKERVVPPLTELSRADGDVRGSGR